MKWTSLTLSVFATALAAANATAATIEWTATPLTGPENVSTRGTLLEALNFSGGVDDTGVEYDTTINGVTFEGFTNGVDSDQNFVSPTATYFSADSVRVTPSDSDNYLGSAAEGGIGLELYDELLSRRLLKELPNSAQFGAATLGSLTVGATYEVQLFMGGHFGSENRYIVIDVGLPTEFGSASTTNFGDFDGDSLTNPNGVVLTGVFTADATTQSFTIQNRRGDDSVPGAKFYLPGYQLREVPEPASAGLLALSVVALGAAPRRQK